MLMRAWQDDRDDAQHIIIRRPRHKIGSEIYLLSQTGDFADLRVVAKLEEFAHLTVDNEPASHSVAQHRGVLLQPVTSRTQTKVCVALLHGSLRLLR